MRPVDRSRSGRSLGNIASKVDRATVAASRLATWAAKHKAATLLREVDPKGGKRLSHCGYVAHGPVHLQAAVRPDGSSGGGFSGLVTCGNVWSCPVCSARISSERREEMNTLLAWARSEGHAVVMATQTFRHDRAMPLAGSLSSMKAAAKRLRQSKGWRALPLVGTVTATEVTHGAHGWHAHQHMICVLRGDAGGALAAVDGLRAAWLAALGREGLTGNAHAWQVQPATQAGAYVAKWGAAEELTLGADKLGRSGSRGPWQLLRDARDGDGAVARLWQEFAVAFKGRRQLFWSQGLKALAGVGDVSDADAAAAVAPEPVTVRSWPGASPAWRSARRRRCALVEAVETGADLDDAEYGPTDAERWRADQEAASVVDDADTPQHAVQHSAMNPIFGAKSCVLGYAGNVATQRKGDSDGCGASGFRALQPVDTWRQVGSVLRGQASERCGHEGKGGIRDGASCRHGIDDTS